MFEPVRLCETVYALGAPKALQGTLNGVLCAEFLKSRARRFGVGKRAYYVRNLKKLPSVGFNPPPPPRTLGDVGRWHGQPAHE